MFSSHNIPIFVLQYTKFNICYALSIDIANSLKQSRRIKFNLLWILIKYYGLLYVVSSSWNATLICVQYKQTSCISHASNHEISPSSIRLEIVCKQFVNLNGLKNLSLILYVDRIFMPIRVFRHVQ